MDLFALQPAIAEIFMAVMALALVMVAAFIAPQTRASKFTRRATIATFVLAGWMCLYNGFTPDISI